MISDHLERWSGQDGERRAGEGSRSQSTKRWRVYFTLLRNVAYVLRSLGNVSRRLKQERNRTRHLHLRITGSGVGTGVQAGEVTTGENRAVVEEIWEPDDHALL